MRIVVVDTETNGTEPWRHSLWEIGAVTVSEQRSDPPTSESSRVMLAPSQMVQSSPDALRINRYHERMASGASTRSLAVTASRCAQAWSGAALASCNVSFDVQFLTRFLLENGQVPTWHYSPIDIKSLCYGARPDTMGAKTSDLLEAFGVNVGQCLAWFDVDPTDGGRHSATADAWLATALLYEAMGWGTVYGSRCNDRWGGLRCQKAYGHEADNPDHQSSGLVVGSSPTRWRKDENGGIV